MGMYAYNTQAPGNYKDYYPVILDGRVLGYVDDDLAPTLVDRLRVMKIFGKEKVSWYYSELGLIMSSPQSSLSLTWIKIPAFSCYWDEGIKLVNRLNKFEPANAVGNVAPLQIHQCLFQTYFSTGPQYDGNMFDSKD